MNKLLITLLVVLFSINTNAQRPNKDKIKALKIAHITEYLSLTSEEAQAFWPLYNANEEARMKLMDEFGFNRLKDIDALSEAEAKNRIENIVKTEAARQKLNKTYFNKMKTILSAKKLLKLMEVERSFRRKMIKEFKNRHRGERPQRSRN